MYIMYFICTCKVLKLLTALSNLLIILWFFFRAWTLGEICQSNWDKLSRLAVLGGGGSGRISLWGLTQIPNVLRVENKNSMGPALAILASSIDAPFASTIVLCAFWHTVQPWNPKHSTLGVGPSVAPLSHGLCWREPWPTMNPVALKSLFRSETEI